MRLKKIVCLALIAALCGCALAATAEESAAPYVMAGFDDTAYRTWATNLFFARMEEKTGVKFAYQQYKSLDEWTKAKADMTKDGELPDVLFKAALTGAECIALREKGVLVDLLPCLEENAPHLWALLQEDPELLKALTLPDGSIVALPFLSTLPAQNYIWVNAAWLNTLRLEEPTTAEDMVKVLTAFRDKDPNRNGRSDEIPLGFMGPFDLKFLAHAFGLVANDYNVFVRDGQVCFMPLEDTYRDFVAWCRDLYREGLLDPNGFYTNSALRTVTDADANPTNGMIITPVAGDVFRTTWGQEDYTILMPLQYDGEQVYRDFAGPMLRGAFAVTSACQDVGAMLRWVDLMYTEEGAVLATIGMENVDYLVDGDGTWRMTEGATRNAEMYAAETLIDGGASYPGIAANDFQRRFSGAASLSALLDRQDQFREYAKMPFPYYMLTEEETAEVAEMQNKIGYAVDMRLAQWVLGEEEISDDSFAAFEAELNELGLQDFLVFWQKVLDRL